MLNGGDPLSWKMMLLVPGLLLASVMACRKEPVPLSAVVVTRNVAARLLDTHKQTLNPNGNQKRLGLKRFFTGFF